MVGTRDHGGGLDAAVAHWGGIRADWLDLSTGINPLPYPIPPLSTPDWTALPDSAAAQGLMDAARAFWGVPEGAMVLAAPGASSLIARLPLLAPQGPGRRVAIPSPTYNEHAAAFSAQGWQVTDRLGAAQAQVVVHPNNPDGRLWSDLPPCPLTVIDESFCDVTPQASLVARAAEPGVVILKSFGKFWGLAGLRLGFAIARPDTIAHLAEALGPWPVSGPALRIGRAALMDHAWARATRDRLAQDADRLDARITHALGARALGGTTLFRLYEVPDAVAAQSRLARAHVWSRIFPYSTTWLRLGLPGTEAQWHHLERAL